MKNAMKKLMAFALVAVMLIGALPFAASATEGDTWNLTIRVDGTDLSKSTTAAKNPAETITVGTCLSYAQQHLGINPELFQRAYVVVGENGQDMYNTSDYFVITADTTVTFVLKAEPANITLYVDGTPHSVTAGEEIGTGILPTGLTRKGYEFLGYKWQSTGNAVSATSVAQVTWNGYEIQSNWKQIGCTECGWAFASGHADDCSQNPNKPTEAPKDETQAPDADAQAYLNIYVNDTKVIKNYKDYTTFGAPGETVSVAACISLAGATNVKSVSLNGAPIAQNATFTLGAADSTTNISITTNSTSGSTGSDSTDTTGKKAVAYIYVGNNDYHSRKIQSDYAFSIDGAVEEFDDWDTNYHYAFNYFTKDGSATQYTNENAVVQVGETVHIRVKVTESKLNHNKVYLQVFMNNDFDVPAKTINVTTTASENGLYLNGNVKDLILEYFSAKSSTGIKIDGMYPSTGSWVAKFLEDTKVKNVSADTVIEMKEDDYVVFNIMVTNAKLKSSSTADSSNYKTGDQIFVPVAIMAVSACTLAAVAFYLNKKRAM